VLFSKSGYQLQEAYNNLATDRQMILDYLKSKGVKSEEIVFSAVDIQKQYAQVTDANGSYRQGEFAGYNLTQSVSIESKEVVKLKTNLSRTVTEIINKGIELTLLSLCIFIPSLQM
jgi:hypothetical protein